MLVPSHLLKKSLESATSRYQESLIQAESYLAERRIPEEVAQRFRLGVVEHPITEHRMFEGRLSIPYVTPSGVVTIRFKCIRDHDCKWFRKEHDPKHTKIMGLGNHDPRLYNTPALFEDTDTLYICEGEPDTWTVSALGLAVVGYQGASEKPEDDTSDAPGGAWEPYFASALRGYERVVVVAHGDDAGRSEAKAIAREFDGGRVAYMPNEEDANSVAQAQGFERLKELLT